jgi:hypothetical protein
LIFDVDVVKGKVVVSWHSAVSFITGRCFASKMKLENWNRIKFKEEAL